MSFGKYAGKRLEDVPATYLLWLYEQPFFRRIEYIPLRDYIMENMDVLEKEVKEAKPYQK